VQALKRGRGDEVDGRGVEESTSGQVEFGDGVAVLEAFHIQPVLLGGLLVGRGCIPPPTLELFQPHLALERDREDSGGVGLFSVDGAVRKRDSRGRQLLAGRSSTSQRGPVIEEIRPLPRILRGCDLGVGCVSQRVRAIPRQSTFP